MTKPEAVALWRILTVLAGWDEIVAVAEVEDELTSLLARLARYHPALTPFDDADAERMRDVLSAEIEANLYYAGFPVRHVVDVPGCDKAGIT